jgi:hypothetical protein
MMSTTYGDEGTPLYPNVDEWYRPDIGVKNVYILHWNESWVEDKKKVTEQVYEHIKTYLSSLHIRGGTTIHHSYESLSPCY